MDIFSLQSSIMKEYKSYISSFININNDRIRSKIESEILTGKLWPEPLIQFNPSYETTASVNDLCKNNVLHDEMKNIFSGYNLYKHQVEAIRLGTSGTDFIVTSGTGSGKSLTYLGTIFNYILQLKQKEKGIKAVIVYPMNALINSQNDEIKAYKEKYQKLTGKEFPISWAQYTGQEDQDERDKIKKNPPDILLTNYMMLELVLTRRGEIDLRNSIYKNIRFLVFDELHTYRGRQGSDVAFLIRRIKARAVNDILCIGTSATMVSGGNKENQKSKVAEVASLLFGKIFLNNQIIDETIIRSLNYNAASITRESLQTVLKNEIDINKTEEDLKSNPLAIWLESFIALTERDGILLRNKPSSLSSIITRLVEYSGVTKDVCEKQLILLFQWISKINETKPNQRDAYLPFKLHQFVSQTGSVYITLDQSESQIITLDPGICAGDSKDGKYLYPVVFSRNSGHPFICVTKDYKNGKLLPRDFEDTALDEDDEEAVNEKDGYIIIGDDIWDPEQDIALLPDAWLKQDKSGNLKVIPKYASRIPKKIFFDEKGSFSETSPLKYEGWFMTSKLLFDPTSGTFFETKTSERTKLARLGSEGRSTATTVLSFLTLKELATAGFDYKEQKLLSFTDNRQDAALQSGHFNDFMDVVELRASIYNALVKAENHILDHSNIADMIFKVLNMKQAEYAANPSDDFPSVARDNEMALKDFIMYRVLYDLRRSWRVILPNLEQCALLEIGYKNLETNSSDNDKWKDIPLLNVVSVEERIVVLFQILDYIRKSYAIHSSEYLTRQSIEKKRKDIQEKLKCPWRFDEDERINEPYFVTYETIKGVHNVYTQSIGSRSALGKYLKSVAKNHDLSFNNDSYNEFIKLLLERLAKAGWLRPQTAFNKDKEKTDIYQLNIDQIIWKLGNEKATLIDLVKQRSYKRDRINIKPNYFFQSLYKTEFSKLKKYRADDHTGQLTTEDRKDREKKFQNGDLSALYCSPTMELGINISTLNVVHMRNVPPNPANYAQRGGRAGRSGQSALVFTFCSSFAPHDRHYFNVSEDMVAGSVAPPQIDLANEELLVTHLHSIYLAELGTEHIDKSIRDILTDDDTNMTLKPDIRANMIPNEQDKKLIKQIFEKTIFDIKDKLSKKKWFTRDWADNKIDTTLRDFENSLKRWINLYQAAQIQLEQAYKIKKSGKFAQNSQEMKDANRNEFQAVRQISLLVNKDRGGSLSEFYPYRYLASEGFLPGYNFTRLPVRTFIQRGDSGEYISRPRVIAIREFGPRNIIYYNGAKYQITQLLLPDVLKNLAKVKICTSSGYCLMEDEFNYEVCPITGITLQGSQKNIIVDMLEMSETKTIVRDRISCEEEERLSRGYALQTYFSVPGGVDRIVKARVKNNQDEFINLRYIPAAKLVYINSGWRNSEEEGFLMGMVSGLWKMSSSGEKSNAKEEERRVKLYTTDTADALYIEPIAALALSYDGVVTLQYALKCAIENIFQVESSEIGVTLMGDEKKPNIFLYEAAEGSLGILSQFVEDPVNFGNLVNEAYNLCRFNDESYKEPASYDDLLSYYNQRDHQTINRWLIKDALEKLKSCSLEIIQSPFYKDYDDQYSYLKEHYDQSSVTESKFLEYLYKNNFRLPDDAQRSVPGIYVKPDFYYHPDVWVFCDGTPHDDEKVKEHDREMRQAIVDRGQQVIEYYYKDDIADLVHSRPDIFKKVR